MCRSATVRKSFYGGLLLVFFVVLELFKADKLSWVFSYLSVPRLSSKINPELNRVELRPVEPNNHHLSMCVQYELNGKCQVSLRVAKKRKKTL